MIFKLNFNKLDLDPSSNGLSGSNNRVSLLTFIVLSMVILAGRFIFPVWGLNVPVFIGLANFICAILGIGFLRKVLLTFFTDRITAFILILIVAGTNFFCLSAYEPDLMHPLLFLCYVLILWSTIKWQETFHLKYAIVLGLIIWLTISVSLNEIGCILIPVFWGIYNKKTFYDKWRAIKQHKWQSILIVSLIMLAVALKILYPDFLSGIPDMSNISQKNHFTFIGPYLPEVIFSFRKGWLIYTPVMIFSILGFYFLAGKTPLIFYSTFLFFIVNLYIVSSWSIWWDGESFGQRSLISTYPVLALPLGYFLHRLLQKRGYVKIPLFILLGFFIFLNLFQTWQYTRGIIDSSRMTREYYGAVFGTVHPDKRAEKYLLREYPDAYREILYNEHVYNGRILVHWDFEKPDSTNRFKQTSEQSKSGHFSFKLSGQEQFSPGISEKFSKLTNKDNTWIRASGYVYYFPEDAVKDAYLVITCNHVNRPYKYKSLFLDREDLIPGKWNKVSMDWQMPYLIDKDDLLQVYFWYKGKKSIYVDDIQIEIFEPRE